MAIRRCPHCDEIITQDSLYCTSCGQIIDEPIIEDYSNVSKEVTLGLIKLLCALFLFGVILIIVIIFVRNINPLSSIVLSFALTLPIILLFHERNESN